MNERERENKTMQESRLMTVRDLEKIYRLIYGMWKTDLSERIRNLLFLKFEFLFFLGVGFRLQLFYTHVALLYNIKFFFWEDLYNVKLNTISNGLYQYIFIYMSKT